MSHSKGLPGSNVFSFYLFAVILFKEVIFFILIRLLLALHLLYLLLNLISTKETKVADTSISEADSTTPTKINIVAFLVA